MADGPTKVHKMVVAREVLKNYRTIEALFPSYLRFTKEDDATTHYGAELAEIGETVSAKTADQRG